MGWGTVADVLAAVAMLCGAFLTLAAGVGVARFPDLLGRMHAATKPQVLGLILLLLGVALRVHEWSVVGMLALVAAFQLLTAPVAAHMVGRAGFRTGKVDVDALALDELTPDQTTAEREAAEASREAGEPDPSDTGAPSDTDVEAPPGRREERREARRDEQADPDL
ncbi:monovalent cation/H(+) antiporter subunit G [Cellulomonas sp. PhB143]|uniref:monovalent cation/H(+) antiporter subunit G n=1 Tax=Cellulomonas sp. PhB143 TaxID=2485186 RepID=UPI000F47B038|nr:monovalent cation/H(+) antiporter subunit G [Cellulomonas sp. PhB143]ROS76470.1 multisubunit sodium/proton antiporter MrpG subunit [Cellulomonas sp. PhB143]